MSTQSHPDAGQSVADLLDVYLPVYDVVLTEHLVVQAPPDIVFRTAKEFDFLSTRSALVTALTSARSVPARLLGRQLDAPARLRVGADKGELPGWLLLGESPGTEVAFGAVGKLWQPDIEWRDTPLEEFAAFAEPGWGKIACHLLVRPDGPDRSVLTYECRTGTTDDVARARMARYWWLIRPFVAYILRAVLRTIRTDAETTRAGTVR